MLTQSDYSLLLLAPGGIFLLQKDLLGKSFPPLSIYFPSALANHLKGHGAHIQDSVIDSGVLHGGGVLQLLQCQVRGHDHGQPRAGSGINDIEYLLGCIGAVPLHAKSSIISNL